MRPSRRIATLALVGLVAFAAACGGTADDAGSDGANAGGGMGMSPSGMHDGGMHDDGGMMGGGATADGDCRTVEGGAVAIAAEGLTYDVSCIEAPAGEAFAIVFDNRDGAPHNVTIEDAAGATILMGDNVTQDTITYDVPALPAGTYAFHCHVHPDMRGVLRVG